MIDFANALILVVDDDAAVRVALLRTLARQGYRAVAAGSLREAVAVLRRDRDTIRVAIVDLGLGRESGLALIRHLRRRDPAIEIVIFSGNAEEIAGLDLGALRVHDFVLKPAAPQRILEAVTRAYNAFAAAMPDGLS